MKKSRKVLKVCICFLMAIIAINSKYVVAQEKLIAYNEHPKLKNSVLQENGKTDTDKISLKNALTFFEKKFKVSFVYELNTIKGKEVSKDVLNNSYAIEDALKVIGEEIHLKYKKVGANVIAIYFEVLQTVASLGNSKAVQDDLQGSATTLNPLATRRDNSVKAVFSFTVSGVVTDAETGKEISGVNVLLKGTNIGTSTNNKGEYSITAPNDAGTLTFSHIGYQSIEVPFNNQAKIDVKISQAAKTVDEVIVIGYGTQKKANLTGAVGSIKSDYLKDRPLTNASQALSGGVSGVFVNQNSGVPGNDNATIRIRGVGTINNSNPLVLIDGIESPIDNLDPNDIASITVLKDAASASIYGSRASNGVILVTTKRGNFNRKPTVSYSGYYGTSKASRLPGLINNSAQFMELANEASINSGSPARYTQQQIDKYRIDGPNTDWLKLIFKNAALQQHNVSVTGGSENTSYLFSAGILDQDAITPNTNFKRYNLRLNLDTKISEKLSIGTSLFLTRGNYNAPQADVVGSGGDAGIAALAVKSNSLLPQYDSKGRLAGPDLSLVNTWGNPFANILFNSFTRLSHQFLGNAFAEYQLIKGLKIKGTIALNYQNNDGASFASKGDSWDWRSGKILVPSINSLRGRSVSNSYSNDFTSWLQANYEKTILKHKFSFLAGVSQETFKNTGFNASRGSFPSNVVQILNAGNATTATNAEFATEWALRSFFGRMNYSFDDKYLLEFNIRRDGSSRFGQNNPYGTFPSVSAGWNISNEKFFSNIKNIDALKIRASIGKLGNQYTNGTDYPFAAEVATNLNYVLNGVVVPGAAQVTYGNANLKWEETTSSDIGIDLGLFHKLTIQADYFVRTAKDILYPLPLPATAGGLADQVVNTAKVQNKGWELSANYKQNISRFRIDVGFNVTNVNSKLLYIDPAKNQADDIVYNGNYILQRGSALGSIYGYKSIGIFQSQEEIDKSPKQSGNYKPGDLKYADIDGNNVIDSKDRVVIGREDPKWLYGANINLSYGGIDFSTILQGVADFQSYSGAEFYAPFFNGANLGTQWLDRWTPTNKTASYPKLYFGTGPSDAVSSFWVQDRSFFRVKNIQLGYTLPKSIMEKINIQKIRIYVNGQNLLTKTKFLGYDPERPSGVSRGGDGYPLLKIYTAGLNVTF
jgi:TonB-dependent starch-binding outer membrane protein SusC